jgi:hypothetical protein
VGQTLIFATMSSYLRHKYARHGIGHRVDGVSIHEIVHIVDDAATKDAFIHKEPALHAAGEEGVWKPYVGGCVGGVQRMPRWCRIRTCLASIGYLPCCRLIPKIGRNMSSKESITVPYKSPGASVAHRLSLFLPFPPPSRRSGHHVHRREPPA